MESNPDHPGVILTAPHIISQVITSVGEIIFLSSFLSNLYLLSKFFICFQKGSNHEHDVDGDDDYGSFSV